MKPTPAPGNGVSASRKSNAAGNRGTSWCVVRMGSAIVVGRLGSAGRVGRKAGLRFYLFDEGHKTDPDPKAYEILGVNPLATSDPEEVSRRLVWALLNEAARAWGEG